jgi:hypothetical protein
MPKGPEKHQNKALHTKLLNRKKTKLQEGKGKSITLEGIGKKNE